MFRKTLLTSVCLLTLMGAASAEVVLNRGNDTDPARLIIIARPPCLKATSFAICMMA